MSAAPVASVKQPRRTQLFTLLRGWWSLALAPVSLALISVAKNNPYAVERLYSSGVYRHISRTLGAVTSLVPFSVAEFGGIALIIWAVVLLCRAVRKAAQRLNAVAHPPRPRETVCVAGSSTVAEHGAACMERSASVSVGTESTEKDRAARIARAAAGIIVHWIGFLAKLASVVLFIFVVSSGLNYYRPEFTSFCGLEVRPSSTRELELLCTELAGRANNLRAQLPEDGGGVTKASASFRETARLARKSFGKLSEDYPELPELPITPKPVANSWVMSQLQLTGVFTFITYESNINFSAPAYSLPATMCHELAHTRGFMREDEANFIGYLACEKSQLPDFTYSGVMLALTHAENRLYAADPEAFSRVDALISDAVRRDFRFSNGYWAKFDGPAAEVSEAVNSAYLRANNQSDGTRSYGRMVDLLLADYRMRHPAA